MSVPDIFDDLVKIGRQAVTDLSSLDSLIDTYLDPVTDITDTLGHLVAPIKALRSVYTTSRKLRFKAFIKSYGQAITASNPSKVNKRLADYAKRPKTRELIYQAIDDAVQSRSVHAARILGHITGLAIIYEDETDMRPFIIISGLRDLNDLELGCAVRIFEYSNHAETNDITTQKALIGAQYVYTVEHLKRLLLLEPGVTHTYDSPNDWGKYCFTEITEQLIDLMKEEGSYAELLEKE
jgi:hypothetical protein